VNADIHLTIDSIVKAINNLAGLSSFHKEKIINTIKYAKNLGGNEPNPHQKLSDLFYDNDVNMNKLFTEDLLDVRKLNENLTEFHKHLGLCSAEEDFAKKFYPYFFSRYRYACVVTQDFDILPSLKIS